MFSWRAQSLLENTALEPEPLSSEAHTCSHSLRLLSVRGPQFYIVFVYSDFSPPSARCRVDMWALGTFHRLVSWPDSPNEQQTGLSGAEEPSSPHLPIVPCASSPFCALGVPFLVPLAFFSLALIDQFAYSW